MPIVSSTLGSPTSTGWNRRSRAGSLSMCSRYSSSVVAPIARSSPRASIGLSRLPASIAPSAAPAPTMVCSSSMKVTISPSLSAISFRTALSRSSNSPRYFAPASIAPRSSAINRLPLRDSGTSPATMRWARPSTIAVLPTPGSPINTGLFFVLRDRTWIVRRISSSDHGVELPLGGLLGEVAAEPLEALVLVLGVLAGHAVTAADVGQRDQRGIAGDARFGQQLPGATAGVVEHREEQVLRRDVLVGQR